MKPDTIKRSIRKATPKPGGTVYRAYLAEDYDGIGRTTIIQFSLSGTGASSSCLVPTGIGAAPAGTAVLVSTLRGKVTLVGLYI